MPELNGIDLAIQMQTQCPVCKVLLMSGHIGPIASLESARKKGFQFPLFAKPVSTQTLVEQLEIIPAMMTHALLDTLWKVPGFEC